MGGFSSSSLRERREATQAPAPTPTQAPKPSRRRHPPMIGVILVRSSKGDELSSSILTIQREGFQNPSSIKPGTITGATSSPSSRRPSPPQTTTQPRRRHLRLSPPTLPLFTATPGLYPSVHLLSDVVCSTDHHAGSAFDHAVVNRATTASFGSPLPCVAVRHRLTPYIRDLSTFNDI
ncbi:hypothetical protein U1Q18_026659 [Sarracenia purpurea var. burkii]